MSSAAYIYREPYRLPAGLLAVLVHGVFFVLLYYGINWRTVQPQGMVVDIWASLPEEKAVPAKHAEAIKQVEPVKPPQPVKLPEPERPVAPPRADINLAKKKIPEVKPVEIKKPVESKKPVEKKQPLEIKQPAVRQQGVEANTPEPTAAEVERERQMAEAQAAITSEIGKYVGLIRSKIKHNIVAPPDVPFDVKTEFDVVLIPGGTVLSAHLSKSSGKPAYDSAVERAIWKSSPLPLPPDVEMFKYFRELHLSFSCTPSEPCSQ